MKGKAVLKYIAGVLMFTMGVVVFLYPVVSALVNERSQTTVVSRFEEAVKEMSEQDKALSLKQAVAYNESLVSHQGIIRDPFIASLEQQATTVSFLNVGGVMGYVEIPSIGLKLPIYEGTSEPVLQSGVGWLTRSSLPVGGESTNTVLTGHRGLPSSKLFTDLDKVKIDDEFYIRTVVGILAYRVIDVRIIEPDDTIALAILNGKDRATLLTCHPLSINSHRLLVIGERIPYTNQLEAQTGIGGITEFFVNLTPVEKDFTVAIMVTFGASCLLILFIWQPWSRKRKKREKEEKEQKKARHLR